jgi:hypothetical protein
MVSGPLFEEGCTFGLGGPKTKGEKIARERADLEAIRRYMPKNQIAYLAECWRSREYECEHGEALKRLRQTIEGMPGLGETDGMGGDAIVSLHYFTGNCDWWITEKGAESESRAFGFARLNGDTQNAELGYVSITELAGLRSMQLDFYWSPKPLRDVKRKLLGQ